MAFTVADYVLKRLTQQRVDTLFGVPAAYCAGLFDAAGRNGVGPIVTASDLEAGYAADGYARTKGLGAVAVANGAGMLSMVNAIAGAFVERSPVVIVNGGPNATNLANLRDFDVLFSHSTGQPDHDLSTYRLVTASATRAETAAAVPGVVDAAIATAVKRKRPVYIEINRDIWTAPRPAPSGSLAGHRRRRWAPRSNSPARSSAWCAPRRRRWSRSASRSSATGLADKVADLIARLGVRWSVQLPAKGVLPEQGDGWVGVYAPAAPRCPP